MKTKLAFRLIGAAAILFLLSVHGAISQSKRPLNYSDFDGWRNIQNQTLSSDGKFLAYGLFPQDGDGEIVIRNLQTGKEWRQPAGARPQAVPDLESDGAPPPVNITLAFTSDSRYLLFSSWPAKADTDKAKRDKKRPEDMPKNSLVIVDLSSGAATRIDRVRNFQVPENGGAIVAYSREAEPGRAGAAGGGRGNAGEAGAAAAGNAGGTSGAATGAAANTGAGRGARREYGTDLVLRNLSTQAERTYPDVLSYTLAKDGATLAYAVASHKDDTNGVFVVATATADAAPHALLAGAGKYSRLTWDFDQTELAFMSDRDNAKAKQPQMKLYLWDRKSDAATEIASNAAGFKDGDQITDKGPITFSHDGKRIFFGVARPDPAESDAVSDLLPDDKVNVDLWHYKDDHIQPMQKVRAAQDRNRTFRAVYHVPEKKVVQLADLTMREATPSEDGLWAVGADDRAYAAESEYAGEFNDFYLVNTLTGERKPILSKQNENLTWSADGKHLLFFKDKNWMTYSVPDGKIANLTAKTGANFWREDFDNPGVPPPYGTGGWTKDGKYVLLYDEFDVWRAAGDGSETINLTHGAGRSARLQFRRVQVGGNPRDPEDRWVDSAEPIYLRAENQDTYDTGFYRTRIDAKDAPQKLIFAAKAFANPLKAKNADVVVVAASTFEEFPDLLVTNTNFTNPQKVTNANPQQAQVNWGTAELVPFLNADGVPLKATLYRPENFDPKKKYPMIVYIYEKLTQNVHAYVAPAPRHTINPTFYASNGYLILEPDIVYTVGQPGQSALKCVLPAIDAIIAKGFVDENNVGIEGHSWGGYQIAYMITQTHRFKAVEAGAPVADMVSAYDGIRWGSGLPRQGQYERGQSRIGASVWESPLKFIENSPIFMADRVTTPLLILQNDSDTAVPWYQGLEYYLALRRLGKEVYLFSYNGEPHGLVRRADQKDFTVRMKQYFDHFLMGAPEPDWMINGIPYLDKDTEKTRFKQATGIY